MSSRLVDRVHQLEQIVESHCDPRLYRVLKFIAVGGTAAVVNLVALYLLTSVFGVWYLISSIASFIVALFTNFFLQKFWAFKGRHETPLRQFGAFFGVNMVNLGFNTLCMYFLVSKIGIHYLYAQIFTFILIAFESFFIYRIIFRSSSQG